jgi:hypothetical protein
MEMVLLQRRLSSVSKRRQTLLLFTIYSAHFTRKRVAQPIKKLAVKYSLPAVVLINLVNMTMFEAGS